LKFGDKTKNSLDLFFSNLRRNPQGFEFFIIIILINVFLFYIFMRKNTPENLAKILELDSCKSEICRAKGIIVIDKDNFELTKRDLVVEYMQLTGDKLGFIRSIKGLITGKLTLNGKQIENYQHEYVKNIKNYNFTNFLTDID
jgi:hypothetical protein